MRAGQQVFRAAVVLAAMMIWSSANAEAPGRLCNPDGFDSECWHEVAERPGCHFWRHKSRPELTTVSWSGSCPGGVADGPGVVVISAKIPMEATYETMVTLQDGRAHGRATGQTSHGNVYEGRLVFGKSQGRWITYGPDGACKQVIHWSEGRAEHSDWTCEEHAAEAGAAALAAEFDAIQGRLAQLDVVRQPVTAGTRAPETGADGSGPLHGSIAFSQEADGGYAWGIAWSFDSAAGALAEATDQCRAYGGTSCHEAGWFEEACGALGIGDDNGYGTGWGATIAEAESDALAQCRAVNRNCRVEVARCSQSQEAGGQGRRPEEDRVVESAPGQVGPCRIFLSDQTKEQFEFMYVTALPEKYFQYIKRDYTPRADWTGPCADGLATGEGEATFEYLFHFPPDSRKSIYRGHARNGRFHGPGRLETWFGYRDSEVYVYRSLEEEEDYVVRIREGEFREGILYEGTVFYPIDCTTAIIRRDQFVGEEEGKC